MFFDINNLSQETSALRKALKHHTRPASELSHVECQQILARAAGFSNLHACKAHLSQPRFQERHSPYLTGDIFELVDFLQRRAVRDEMKTFLVTDDAPWNSGYIDSRHRMADQIASILQDKLRVHPKLKTALEKTETDSPDELHREEMLRQIAFQDILWKSNSGNCSDAEYDNAYADWRLATFSRYLKFASTLPSDRIFENILKQGSDFHLLVAAVLTLHDTDRAFNRFHHFQPADRQFGKAVNLQLMGGGRLNERCFGAMYGIRAPSNLDGLEDKWHDKFPEFRAWHIWCELKPVLAPDADAYWAKRH
jgi:hypothetical protein